jgi:hypothetical protein
MRTVAKRRREQRPSYNAASNLVDAGARTAAERKTFESTV